MRKIISIVLAIILLAGAVLIAKYLIDNKQKPKPRFNKIVKTVFVETWFWFLFVIYQIFCY